MSLTIIEEPLKQRDLKEQIQHTEKHLFALKAQLAKMSPQATGGPVILAPRHYRCTTCGNDECLCYRMLPCREKTIIANQTALNGCLAWLSGAKS